MGEKLSHEELEKRVPAAMGVVDAILKGTLLPEPSEEEQAQLGVADFDPELRYRVAKDVIEQAFGKPKQQMEIEGGGVMPAVLLLPSFMADDSQPARVEVGPVRELEAGDTDTGGMDA